MIDDHRLLLEVWASILRRDGRFTVQATASDPETGLVQVLASRPQVVLCDIQMKPLDGFELTRRIRAESPGTRVIGVSFFSSPVYARKMVEAGASGYVTKNASLEEWKAAILAVATGGRYYSGEIVDGLVRASLEQTEPHPLTKVTEKERQIIEGIRDGLSSRLIGERLGIALKTVEVHRYHILKKLGLPNTASLVNLICSYGI